MGAVCKGAREGREGRGETLKVANSCLAAAFGWSSIVKYTLVECRRRCDIVVLLYYYCQYVFTIYRQFVSVVAKTLKRTPCESVETTIRKKRLLFMGVAVRQHDG